MIWEIVFVVVAFLLFAGLTYLYYSGLFYPINLKIAKPYDGSLPIAYKYVIGNYYNCGKLFQEFVGATSNDTTLIGMYYDDPDVVVGTSYVFIFFSFESKVLRNCCYK